MRHVPWLLVVTRAALGPIILAIAIAAPSRAPLIVPALWLAVLSDIIDGIIARRLGVATARLRKADSLTDLFFFLCTLAAAWIARKDVLRPHLPEVGVLLGLELACNAVSLVRFRRPPATHAISAKFFGLTLVGAFTALFGWGVAGVPWYVMFSAGLVTDADVLAILLILPRWTSDVPSCFHALQIRRGREITRNPLFN